MMWTYIQSKQELESYISENEIDRDNLVGDKLPFSYPFWIKSYETSCPYGGGDRTIVFIIDLSDLDKLSKQAVDK